MKKVFLSVCWCIFAIGLVTTMVGVQTKATSWSEVPVNVLSKSKPPQGEIDIINACMGLEQSIEVELYGLKNDSCVFGRSEQFRFARFIQDSAFKYAIAYPRQSIFYEIRGVCTKPGCVYSPDTDVFMDHQYIGDNKFGAIVHRGFSQKMLRQIDPMSKKQYYRLNTDDDFGFTVGYSGVSLAVEAINLSNNGKWAVLEIPSYGIVRLDTGSMDMRRIVAPGAEYGLMNDPHYELVITDDGKYIATTGYRAATSMYEIDDRCGDRANASMQRYFDASVVVCRRIPINFEKLLPMMSYGFNLRFIDGGQRLGVTAMYTSGDIDRVILGPSEPHASVRYVALGDSFTSGEGELEDKYYKKGTNENKLKCHVSLRSYPYIVAEHWGVRGENVACSGARTIDVYGTDTYTGQNRVLEGLATSEKNVFTEQSLANFRPGVVRQSEFVSRYQPGVVSIGIGGNDAGLVGKLASCLSPGDCEWVSSKDKIAASAKEISEVYFKIRELIRYLRQIAPGAKLFTLGYPSIIDSTANAPCDVITKTLLSPKERVFIYESIRYLNEVNRAASNAENVQFVDVSNSFVNHNLCGVNDSSMMNGVRLGDDIASPIKLMPFRIFGSESYHPTPVGHDAIADAILTTFGDANKVVNCENCSVQGTLPKASDYWEVLHTASYVRQFEDSSIGKDIYELGEKIIIKTDPSLFMKNTESVAILRSESRLLAKVEVSDDGSVSFEGNIPADTPPGYHTLHLMGIAPDGTEIDMYRVVAIKAKGDTVFDNDLDAESTIVKAGGGASHVLEGVTVYNVLPSAIDSIVAAKGSAASKLRKDSRANEGIVLGVVMILTGVVMTALLYGYVRIRNKNSREQSRQV